MKVAEKWILDRTGPESEGLAAIFPSMMNTILAFQCLGYSDDHPRMRKAVKDLEGLEVDDVANGDFRVQPCLSPVWDTAITMTALGAAGVKADDPVMRKGADWLLAKEVKMRGDWVVKNPTHVTGGWAFEYFNDWYPDVDDTAKVLWGYEWLGRVILRPKKVQRREDWLGLKVSSATTVDMVHLIRT